MKLSGRHYAIIIFTLITAVMHLLAAFDKQLFPGGPDPLFILNGLGYLGLLGAYFLPISFLEQRHELVRRVYMGYAILTLYGVPAKIAEVILLLFLSADKSQS